jgi:hypothetical protein
MKNLMLDLETLSSSNNGAIIQIGACYFDWDGNIGKKLLINTIPDKRFDFNIETINWWFTNKDSVIKSLTIERIALHKALIEFSKFSKEAEHVWSHSTFDFVLLMNAYQKLNIKEPFGFRASRDIRTLVYLSGVSHNNTKTVRDDEQHNALHDCIYQVGYCVKAFSLIKKNMEVKNEIHIPD